MISTRYALDHVFVCCAEGAPNTHRGQGTACRRFFFAIILRPAGDETSPPFPSWAYHPSYLPPTSRSTSRRGRR